MSSDVIKLNVLHTDKRVEDIQVGRSHHVFIAHFSSTKRLNYLFWWRHSFIQIMWTLFGLLVLCHHVTLVCWMISLEVRSFYFKLIILDQASTIPATNKALLYFLTFTRHILNSVHTNIDKNRPRDVHRAPGHLSENCLTTGSVTAGWENIQWRHLIQYNVR